MGSSSCSSCFSTYSFISIVVVLLLILLSAFSSSFLSPIFVAFPVLILSTVFFFTFSKRRVIEQQVSVEDEAVLSGHLKNPPEREDGQEIQPGNMESKDSGNVGQMHDRVGIGRRIQTENKETQENVNVDQIYVRSPDLLSVSESVDLSSTSGSDSEVDWSMHNKAGQIQACSDDSISDDENLIEIALPDGRFVESESQRIFRSNLLNVSSEAIFRQHGLLELLSEINEEDNLIEIDLSMGSIKCPRFEIEA